MDAEFAYVHIWPILDPDRPISALQAEACCDLDRMAQLAGARLIGAPKWTIAEDRLVCKVPAEPYNPDAEPNLPKVIAGRPTPPAVVAEIRRLAARGLNARAIAVEVGADRKTVARYARGAVAA